MSENKKNDVPYLIRMGALFYRPNCQGYTQSLEAAGIYTYEVARREAEARPNDVYITPLSAFAHEIATAHALITEKRIALGMANAHEDDDIRLIEDRHDMDARWFRAGLHDQNGYVAMAHKDRGTLLERLRGAHERELRDRIQWIQSFPFPMVVPHQLIIEKGAA